LLAEGLADAERRNVTLSEDEFYRLKAECERKAFRPMLDAMKARDGLAPQEQSDRAVSSEPPARSVVNGDA
jgi:hypothetical protein